MNKTTTRKRLYIEGHHVKLGHIVSIEEMDVQPARHVPNLRRARRLVERFNRLQERLESAAAAVDDGGEGDGQLAYVEPFPEAIIPGLDARPRIRVTVAQWHTRPVELAASQAWTYSRRTDLCGLDPWREIESTDATGSMDELDLWFTDGHCAKAKPTDFVYVRERDAPLLGRAPALMW